MTELKLIWSKKFDRFTLLKAELVEPFVRLPHRIFKVDRKQFMRVCGTGVKSKMVMPSNPKMMSTRTATDDGTGKPRRQAVFDHPLADRAHGQHECEREEDRGEDRGDEAAQFRSRSGGPVSATRIIKLLVSLSLVSEPARRLCASRIRFWREVAGQIGVRHGHILSSSTDIIR